MMTDTDDRIPLRFGPAAAAGPQDALLLEEGAGPFAAGPQAVARFSATAGHRFGCICCGGGRAAAAVALAGLFQDRATGRVPWFTRVLAVVADPAAVAEALRADRVAAARFRVEG
jgi:hypothetical protein